MPKVVHQADLLQAFEAVRKYGNATKAAQALKIPRSTLQARIDKFNRQEFSNGSDDPSNPVNKPKYEVTGSNNNNNSTIDSISEHIKTLEDALEYGKVDTDVWQVDKYTINSWEVAMKLKKTVKGQEVDTVVKKGLWQVKVWLTRIVSKSLSDTASKMFDRMKKFAPKYNRSIRSTVTKDPHMLEVALFDAHFGKYAWAAQTGEECNLQSTSRIYLQAVDDLLAKSSGFNIDSIILPVGQDFFHINNVQNTTRHGTPQSVDQSLFKIFDTGLMAIREALDKCRLIAPTKVLWVPGNHDYETSWYLAKCLECWYHNDRDISIDTTPTTRKYHKYGTSLIGFTHGDEEAHRDLPTIMAAEVPELWAGTTVRHWHLGHYHKRKETIHNAADTFNGIEVRVLPSLSGTDAWHYEQGYTKNKAGRSAEAYLWCKRTGYAAHFNAYVH